MGTFRRLFFGHNLGSSCDRNDLGCSPLFACRCDLGCNPLFFYRHTGPRVPIDIVPPSEIVLVLVAARPGAQYARLVPLVGLRDYTHTGP